MTIEKIFKSIITVNLICFCISISKAQVSTDFIDKLQTYQKSVKIVHVRSYDRIDSTTFNLDQYLSLFNKLQKDTSKVFNFVYFDSFTAGRPYIYAINKKFSIDNYIYKEAFRDTSKLNQIGIRIQKEIQRIKLPKLLSSSKNSEYVNQYNDTILVNEDSYKQFALEKLYDFLNDSTNKARNYLVPEKSKEGYLQYLFFYIMGEQFALKWHALYEEKSIITSTDQIKQIIKKYWGSKMYETEKKELKKLLKIDPVPMISIDTEGSIIKWYEIEDQDGIYERTYRISNAAPYKIQKINEKQHVAIGMNFIF